jgi:hypothetical protein
MTAERETKYWVIVASKDHVQKGISEGFAQACHGKTAPLKRMRKGDFVIYYSGKQTMGNPDKCQEFTAIGQVENEETYAFPQTADFCPSRRDVIFFEHLDVSVLPLINELDFIPDKQKWGYPFRFGFFEINKHDFDLISTHMIRK